MTTTSTRTVDRFGNVSWIIARDGQTIGTVVKTSTGYQADYANGSWSPAKSIKAARQVIEARS